MSPMMQLNAVTVCGSKLHVGRSQEFKSTSGCNKRHFFNEKINLFSFFEDPFLVLSKKTFPRKRKQTLYVNLILCVRNRLKTKTKFEAKNEEKRRSGEVLFYGKKLLYF